MILILILCFNELVLSRYYLPTVMREVRLYFYLVCRGVHVFVFVFAFFIIYLRILVFNII